LSKQDGFNELLKFHDDDTLAAQLKQPHTELGLIKTVCDYKEDDNDE
jgi:hypothetical protein